MPVLRSYVVEATTTITIKDAATSKVVESFTIVGNAPANNHVSPDNHNTAPLRSISNVVSKLMAGLHGAVVRHAVAVEENEIPRNER